MDAISQHLGVVLAILGTHGAQLCVTSIVSSMPPPPPGSFWYAWFYGATHKYLNLQENPTGPAAPAKEQAQ